MRVARARGWMGRMRSSPSFFSFFAALAFAASGWACSGSSDSGATNVDGGGDAPSGDGGSCRAASAHRPTDSACASNADAGPIDGGCGGTITPHDDCLSDDDCSAHGASDVCACQAPSGGGCGAAPVTGNACVPANCKSDSDCSECGACIPEYTCGVVTGYYCATRADACSSNADCSAGLCLFRNGHFSCVTDVACAG